LSPVSTGIGDDLWRVYRPGIYQLSLAIPPWVGAISIYRRWFRPSLGRNGASEVTTLWRCI